MASISLKPLLSKQAINPQEFWPAYPNISSKIAYLFGGKKQMEKIPIFPIGDLQWTEDSDSALKIQKLDVPIAFFFDATGGDNGVYLAYRIKLVCIPRFRCFCTSVKNRGIEMIYFSPPERTFLTSLGVKRIITKFGPASMMLSNSTLIYQDNPSMALIEKILKGEHCQEKIQTDCLSWYDRVHVELDKD